MNKLIAYCGLNCQNCDTYIATLNNDDDLRKKTAELWSKLNNVQISPEMINCTGCRTDGVKTPFCDSVCQIRKCAQNKSYKTCSDCEQLQKCETLKMITDNNSDAIKNLKA